MNEKRKKVENFILKYIDKLLPKSQNTSLYQDKFRSMSDKEFEAWIERLEKKEEHLVVIVPNWSKIDLDIERNLKLGEELGIKFFSKLWIGPNGSDPKYLTPIEFFILDLPFRRQSQTIIKKIKIPKHNRSIDQFTFQPTGDSKGSKISKPEAELLVSTGFEQSAIEFDKYRGGDRNGFLAMNAMIDKYGIVRQEVLEKYASGVVSTKTLKVFLTGMHLKNNL